MSLATDIISRVDEITGVPVNYRETTIFEDGTPITDDKCDEVIYRKKGVYYYKRQFEHFLNIKWFGAKGDGSDATEAFLKASKYNLKIFIPDGKYSINQPIDFKNSLEGESVENTLITVGSDIDYVFKIQNRSTIEGFFLDCASKSKIGVLFQNCNGSLAQKIRVERAIIDNIKFSESGNNSNTTIRNSLIRICGKSHTEGSVSATQGNSVLTVNNSVSLLGLEIFEPLQTYLFIEGEVPREVQSITSNTIEVYPAYDVALVDKVYRLAIGSNINIGRNGDNSLIKIENNTLQAGNVAGVKDHSLYGATCFGNTYEFTGIARIIGHRSSGNPTYGANEYSYYIEGNKLDYLYAYCGGNMFLLGSLGEEPKVFKYPNSKLPFMGEQISEWSALDLSPVELTLTTISKVIKIGSLVKINASITYPANSSPHGAYIGKLPYDVNNYTLEKINILKNNSSNLAELRLINENVIQLFDSSGNALTNSQVSGNTFIFELIYTI